MNRILGRGNKTPKPTINDVSQRMGARADDMDKKIAHLDSELRKIRDQISKTRSPAVQQRLKQRAMQLLKQKRMYEGHRDSVSQQQYNLDQTAFTTEQLKDSVDMMSAMKGAARDLKKQYKKINLDRVEKMQDDMYDLMEDAREIQDLMSRSYDTPEYIDDDELMGELSMLEDDLAMEEELGGNSYLDDLDRLDSGVTEGSSEAQRSTQESVQLM